MDYLNTYFSSNILFVTSAFEAKWIDVFRTFEINPATSGESLYRDFATIGLRLQSLVHNREDIDIHRAVARTAAAADAGNHAVFPNMK